jgi:superfamily II DNA or RNA helicase
MSDLLSPRAASERQLRPNQERAIERLREAIASGKRRPMLQGRTGIGKGVIAAKIAKRACAKGKRVAVIVPALSLIDQMVAVLEDEGIDCLGVMQGRHERTDSSQPVQVVSVQTLARRKRPDVDLVIVDEAHQLHKEIFAWMRDCPDVLFIGLSATPWSRGLGEYYDDLIIADVEPGDLSPVRVFAPSKPDLAAVRVVGGDYHEGDLAAACDKAPLIGDVVETWLARAAGRLTLVYGVNRAHAKHLQERFLEAGIGVAYVDGFTERAERERIFARFRAGEIKVICSVAALDVGLDLPMIACIVDARPTRSEIKFVQAIGRGLRRAEGKRDLLVRDHAGNHLRLGRVEDIHHDRLDAGEPRRKGRQEQRQRSALLPRLCDDCKGVLPARATRCPECGTIGEARTDIEHRDGELVELGSGATSSVSPSIADMARFYGELRFVAWKKGHRDGWIYHKFRERFGVWPDDPRVRCAMMREPCLKTRNWLKSRAIAYARRVARG